MDNNKHPLVSIVFTSYNHHEYLRQALESLINQTYPNLEIIIVDDCSTDGSQLILKEFEHHKNINLILSKSNSGSYVKASNYGASFATGKYILFAQCDDFSEVNQIQTLVSVLEGNSNVGVVFSKSNLIDKEGAKFSDDFIGREIRFKRKVKKDEVIKGGEMKEFLSYSCVIPNLSAALIRHDLFKEVHGLSDRYLVVADWEFWLELSEKTNFHYLSKPLNNFRQHETTIRSEIKMSKQVFEIYEMFNNHCNKYNLNTSQQYKIKKGAGGIWFSYFFENKKLWIQSFFKIYSEIRKRNKKTLYFLILGANKIVIEFVHRKIKG